MDDKAVIFSVFYGFLKRLFCLIVAFPERFSKAGTESELQLVFLVQIGDEIPDPLKAAFIKVIVDVELKAVGNCLQGKIISVFPTKIQKEFMERDLQIFSVL